ncbi:MAG: pyridoxal-phosphate dependent enzyme [Planctomycetota bacterium]
MTSTDRGAQTRARDQAAMSRAAAAALADRLPPTPVRPALALRPEGDLVLKLESTQPTGSFKVRGALHRVASLLPDERERGIVAASTGNHGLAVAYAARLAGVRAAVLVPEPTPDQRVHAIEGLGASVERVGAECGESEAIARTRAAETGETFVSPYNDPLVMAGQGTLAVELVEQVPRLGRLYVPVGGGGLIGGIAAVVKDARPDVELVGCSPRADHPMHASVEAGRIVDTPHDPTLSLATAGGLEEGSVTLQPCIDHVDRWELVEEDEIAAALRRAVGEERVMVEGAAAVALAVCLRDARPADGRVDCSVVCGGNLDLVHLERVVAGAEVRA